MRLFQVHTIESAPADSTASLRTLEQALGFVPNLALTMAESPLIGGFVGLQDARGRRAERCRARDRGNRGQPRERLRLLHGRTLDLRADAERRQDGRPGRTRAPRARRSQARRLVPIRTQPCGQQRPRERARAPGPARRRLLARRAVRRDRAGRPHDLANLAHGISEAPLDDAFQPQAWRRPPPDPCTFQSPRTRRGHCRTREDTPATQSSSAPRREILARCTTRLRALGQQNLALPGQKAIDAVGNLVSLAHHARDFWPFLPGARTCSCLAKLAAGSRSSALDPAPHREERRLGKPALAPVAGVTLAIPRQARARRTATTCLPWMTSGEILPGFRLALASGPKRARGGDPVED